jgi:sugar transferase (PEP-CTERM/EpsH1 system associated)
VLVIGAVKILWVKSGGLVPLDHGGRIRSFQLAKILAQVHEVSLFTFYQPAANDPHAELRNVFSRVLCVPLEVPRQGSPAEYAAYAKNLFSSRPYSVAKYCQPHVARRLREHLKQESYDLIVCDFLLTAGVIPWDFPKPKVIFTHNIEAQIWERHFRIARNPIWKAACYREFLTMQRMERDYLRRSDHVLAVSEPDQDFFAGIVDRSKISVVPTGVDVDYFRPKPELEERNTLVFTGSMDWLANEDGIVYFMDKVLPIIRQQVSDAKLWVVGRRPSSRLERLAKNISGVRLTGTVADIRPYMAKASVYVVPLLVGGGTRLKIFEAMAMGKAIVSTSIGAEGLPVVPGENILLADTAEDFALQVVALLRSQARREDLGRLARQLVERNYSWNSVGIDLSKTLASLVSCHKPSERFESVHENP